MKIVKWIAIFCFRSQNTYFSEFGVSKVIIWFILQRADSSSSLCECGEQFTDTRGMHDDVIKWKRFPRYWPFVRRIHRLPANSPHRGQWRGPLMFSLIYARISGWVNTREAGDLRRLRPHWDVTVMVWRNDYVCHGCTTGRCAWLVLLRPSTGIWTHNNSSSLREIAKEMLMNKYP